MARHTMMSLVMMLAAVGCTQAQAGRTKQVSVADVAEGAERPAEGFVFECWTGMSLTFQASDLTDAKYLPANVWELTQQRYGVGQADLSLYYTPRPGELCGVV